MGTVRLSAAARWTSCPPTARPAMSVSMILGFGAVAARTNHQYRSCEGGEKANRG